MWFSKLLNAAHKAAPTTLQKLTYATLGGTAIWLFINLIWSAGIWLKYGLWVRYSISDVAVWLGLNLRPTGWIGLDELAQNVNSLPLIAVPIAMSIVMVGLAAVRLGRQEAAA